jgi:hypothetical protein
MGIPIHHGRAANWVTSRSRDDVLCGGDVVGRIFLSQAAPQDRPMDVDAGLRAA